MRLFLSALVVCISCLLPAHVGVARPPCPLIELRISAQTRSGEIAVTTKTALRKGVKLRLDLRPVRKAYVYVIHVSPLGTASLLYAARAQPLQPGARIVLPETGAYELDGETGQETIAVIASESALETASPEHARIVRMVEAENRLPPGASLGTNVTRAPREPAPASPAPSATAAQPAQDAAPRSTPAPGFQDLYGDMRGFSNLPTAVAFRGDGGVAVASVQLNHVK